MLSKKDRLPQNYVLGPFLLLFVTQNWKYKSASNQQHTFAAKQITSPFFYHITSLFKDDQCYFKNVFREMFPYLLVVNINCLILYNFILQ